MNLNWPLRGVIVLLSSVCDDAGIGKEFACSQVRVVCRGCKCGNFTECGQMSRLLMILNWPLRGVMVLLRSLYDDAVAG